MAKRRCCNACAYEPPQFHGIRSTSGSRPRGPSIAADARPSIPFRRETEIGEPALGAAHLRYRHHLVVRQREVEDLDIFRQPLDLRGPRDRADILLYQPAQTNLRGGLAMGLPDPRQPNVAFDAAFGHRTV